MSPADLDDSAATQLSGLVPRRSYLLALLVLIGALIFVFTAWTVARDRELRSAESEFRAQSENVTDLVRQRLVYYELVAGGGVSLFASVARPTPQQWRAYVDGMDLNRRFSAMLGLGFGGYVRSSRLPDLQTEWRESGYGMLEVRPRGIRRDYGPILYLEPKTAANVAAIGYDMYSEPTRAEAMLAALESGQPQLTGPVHLIQDGAEQHVGLVLYLPVYRGGDRPASLDARRSSMQGWVYVPFRMQRFVENSLNNSFKDVRFRVYDIDSGPNALLYSSPGERDKAEPAFRHSTLLNVYGRHWRLDFESAPQAQSAPRLASLQNMLALGLFASLLLYAVALTLARTEARARKIALRMTEDYRRSETRFRSAMRYSAIGKALLDSDGRIVDANPALVAIVGNNEAALQGMRFDALFENEDQELIGKATGRTDTDGVHRATRRLHREDGLVRQVQLTYAPVPGNIGQDISGLVQVEDVTERLRAEARVHALNRTLEARVALRTRELSQANQELEAFAYSVSHDLRAPLRAIEGFSRILIEKHTAQLDDSGRDYLGRVRKAAGRMGELIDALLQMSRLARSELKLDRIDLSKLAGEIVEELRTADPQRSVQVDIQPGLQVVGDAALLRNLLANLLGNAWKFTRLQSQPRIAFGADINAQGLPEFYVRDNGAGFAQEYVGKLFRPFQRLHTDSDFPGHGIGLASVKRIVERHGGTIRADGVEGQGATFTFTLPGE
ncbi:CHASE domain-containing protein [Lysobacter sp. 5GHs7-4]|uniref:CHASE domain-containing protein n=1 Tax=Lysobacter sp. 5GHs7-4 TaxID=2904253 RepID=UPI001E2EF8C9|nr:CHASE domain-containing protein [Lysobacter sp. 5GHs7-4]UHQ21566.1 CHASE domain-containing protein [Lysobacter sp. 5GHs7-4]